MFKLMILSVLLAAVAAAPGYLGGGGYGHGGYLLSAPATTVLHEPTFAKVGAIVNTVPTAVSHSSLTQVHSGIQSVQPIIAPAVKTTVAVAPSYVYHAAPAPAALHFAAAAAAASAAHGPSLSLGHGWAPSW